MISIALCTYNGERYIREQLQSIMEQTCQPDEIIICDDCSKDDTVTIVKDTLSIWSGTYKVFINEKNLGYRLNFQKAISKCTGDYIYLCDQDDVWNADKIKTMQQAFYENPQAVMVFHDIFLVDCNLQILYKSFWEILRFNYHEFLKDNYNSLLESNVVQGAASAFKKDLFEYAVPFCELAHHDEWLALVAVARGKIVPIPKQLAQYRQHQNVVGGLPLTLRQKFINIRSPKQLQVTMSLRLKKLCERSNIFDVYADKVSNLPSFTYKLDYPKFRLFMERRLGYIQSGSWKLICILPLYFTFARCPSNAIKTFIKDWFITFLLVHKVNFR